MLAVIFGSPFLLRFVVPRALALFAPRPVFNEPLDDAARKRILGRIRRPKDLDHRSGDSLSNWDRKRSSPHNALGSPDAGRCRD